MRQQQRRGDPDGCSGVEGAGWVLMMFVELMVAGYCYMSVVGDGVMLCCCCW